ncbi:hypothetical protein P7C73_g2132, partial [Tremellales sp. Uapishka_1]
MRAVPTTTNDLYPDCPAAPIVADLIGQLHQDLVNTEVEETRPCGPAVIHLIREASSFLVQCTSTQIPFTSNLVSREHVIASLDHLFALADENINAIEFNLVQSCWLRLYTDVSLLRSLLDLVVGPDGEGKERIFWLRAVRRLDMAIIVAGAVGVGRMDWIQRTIKEIQKTGLRRRRSAGEGGEGASRRSSKRRCIAKDASESTDETLLFAPSRIAVLRQAPSVSQYLQHHITSPFILKRHLDSPDSPCPPWPAVDRWRSAEYLLDLVGEGRVVPVEVGGAYDEKDWGQRIIPFRDFLARAGYQVSVEDDGEDKDEREKRRLVEGDVPEVEPPLYLAQHPLLKQFPELDSDISLPDYVWSSPPEPVATPSYRPPENEDGLLLNVWVGSGKGEIISPAHTDPYYNCYAQVLGRKRVWLAPPAVSTHMYAYGLSPIKDHSTDSLTTQYITNTSTVPILRPAFDLAQIKEKHPSFYEHVWPVSLEAVLEPGDMMIMPPGWWHAMRGEGEGVGWSVSMWY